MSQKCPYCGSYNTEVAVSNYVERGIVQAGRAILIAGAMTFGSLAGPSAGKVAGYNVMKNTDPGTFNGHRCCNCGREF